MSHHEPIAGPLDSHPQFYEARISAVLNRIVSNPVGAIVLNQIGQVSGHVLTIVPLVRLFNAITEALSSETSAAAGIPRYDDHGLARVDGRVRFGLGGGSDVRIFYSPGPSATVGLTFLRILPCATNWCTLSAICGAFGSCIRRTTNTATTKNSGP